MSSTVRTARRYRVKTRFKVILLAAAVIAAWLIIWGVSQKPVESLRPVPLSSPQANVAGGGAPLPGVPKVDLEYLALVNWENEYHAVPDDLIDASAFFGDEVELANDNILVRRQAAAGAKAMFEAAKEAGLPKLVLNNAYRSVEYQAEIFANRLKQDPDYGSDPYNRPVVAMPGGKSEHATGLALDILSTANRYPNDDFARSAECAWLMEHAHEYGFILRYPEDKENITGVVYEPWHYRYVGADAARSIYESGDSLEEYIDKISKQSEI